MVAIDFIDYLSKFQVTTYVGLEDFADRLNFLFTVVILLLFSTVITIKQYMLKPIACYMANDPGGTNLLEYVEHYCWVQGTIPNEEYVPLPNKDSDWDNLEDRKIVYYQWVPFVLALQCIMFYVPRVLWQLVCYNRTGTDLQQIVSNANDAGHADHETRERLVNQVARTLEDMFYKHRECRTSRRARVVQRIHGFCNFFVISKRMGTWLVMGYLGLKVLYLTNAIGQLYLMQSFLGFNKNYTMFGAEMTRNIMQGRDWRTTMVFPRVTYCYARIKHMGQTNAVTAQCVLPVNMLNEKIYIFLWYWILFTAVVTMLSIPRWLARIVSQRSHQQVIKKLLRMGEAISRKERDLLTQFTQQFLRHDGVFLLNMIALNAGDLVASDIVCQLWNIYKQHYRDRNFACDNKSHRDNLIYPEETPLATIAEGAEKEKEDSSLPSQPSSPKPVYEKLAV